MDPNANLQEQQRIHQRHFGFEPDWSKCSYASRYYGKG